MIPKCRINTYSKGTNDFQSTQYSLDERKNDHAGYTKQR